MGVLLLLPMVACLPEFFKFGIGEGDSTLVKAEDAAVMITLKYAPFMMYGKSYFKIVVSEQNMLLREAILAEYSNRSITCYIVNKFIIICIILFYTAWD